MFKIAKFEITEFEITKKTIRNLFRVISIFFTDTNIKLCNSAKLAKKLKQKMNLKNFVKAILVTKHLKLTSLPGN
jgi:hypothetical protein